MLKEIHEQVTSVHDTLLGRISELSGEVILSEVTYGPTIDNRS